MTPGDAGAGMSTDSRDSLQACNVSVGAVASSSTPRCRAASWRQSRMSACGHL